MLAGLEPEVRAFLLNPPPYEEEESLDWLTLTWGGPYPSCDCSEPSTDCMFCQTVQMSAHTYLDGLVQ